MRIRGYFNDTQSPKHGVFSDELTVAMSVGKVKTNSPKQRYNQSSHLFGIKINISH